MIMKVGGGGKNGVWAANRRRQSKKKQSDKQGGVKATLLGLYDPDACRHILSLPLTGFTPSSPEALHTKQA
jgi:hypothetical protein